MCLYAESLSRAWRFVTLWTVARQAPLSMGFSRQEYWSGLPCPPPGDLPDPGIEPRSPSLQADSLPTEPPGSPTPCTSEVHLLQLMNKYWSSMISNWIKPAVYLRVHSWYCAFCGFCQTDNIMCPAWPCHHFTALKILCALHPTPTPGNHWASYCVCSLAFSRMSYNWNHTVWRL